MEIIKLNSEKMILPSNTFERAIVNTFNKVNKITDCINGVTIGPNSNITESNNQDVSNLPIFIEKVLHDEETNPSRKRFEDDKHDVQNSTFYAGRALVELENLRRIDVVDNINRRVQKMISVEEELKLRSNECLKLMKEEMNINNKLKRRLIESNINDDDLIISRKFSELLKSRLESKSKNENEVINEKNTKSECNEEIKVKAERIHAIGKIQSDYCNVYGKILENMENCKNRTKLWSVATPDLKKIGDFIAELNNITLLTKAGNVEKRDVEACEIILQGITLLADKLNNKISQINEEETKLEEIRQQETSKSAEIQTVVFATDHIPEEAVQAECEEKNIDDRYVCQESLEEWKKLEEYFNNVSKQVDTVVNNSNMKTFIRRLKIAMNTPINSLSSVNAAHIQDKFYKMSQLLRGSFSFSTENNCSATREEYFPFLVDFMSKKFINQGENLVPSKPEDAFLLASIIVAIWIEFPDFGPVLLAHFMKKCPYTIPAYWPQYKGQTEKDYYISRGYQYNSSGTIEDQNSFLKRMTGIFMLYVAIMISIPRKNQPHPYGLQNAWKWLAAILNLEPRSDISATLLHTFLELAGYKLSQFYGIQFWKVMHLLNNEYLTKIDKVTSADFRGPVSRLKEYIQGVLRDGRLPQPNGILSANYW